MLLLQKRLVGKCSELRCALGRVTGAGGGAGTRVLTFMKQIFVVLDSGETAEHNPDGFLFLEVTVQWERQKLNYSLCD